MGKISSEMNIGEVVMKFPETVHVMMKYGLHCVGCHVAAFETIKQGAMAHGMDKKQLDKMIEDLNKIVEQKD